MLYKVLNLYSPIPCESWPTIAILRHTAIYRRRMAAVGNRSFPAAALKKHQGGGELFQYPRI